jgi:superfamily II DNA or RNA helicase
MTILELLRPLTTYGAQQRGWQYLNQVRPIEGNAQGVVAEVHGSEVYGVRILVDRGDLRVWCSCPYFADRGSGCKHLWATAVVAHEKEWLTNLATGLRVVIDVGDDEDYELAVPDRPDATMEAATGLANRRPAPPPDWAMALAAVTPMHDGPGSAWSGSQLIYVLTAPVRATLGELPLVVERLERKRDGAWSKPQPSRLTLATIPHLPDADDRWALALIHSTASYPRDAQYYGYELSAQPLSTTYLKSPLLDLLLPRLCPTGRVRLRQARANVLPAVNSDGDVTLQWDPGEPWRFALVVTREDAGTGSAATYRIDGVLRRGEEQSSVHQFAVLTDSLAMIDGVVSRFDPAGGFDWAVQLRARGALAIPADSRRMLVDSLARSGVERVDLPDDLRWEERDVTPRFRATIGKPHTYSAACPLELAVEYDGTQAALNGGTRVLSADGRIMFRRNQIAEREALVTLKRYGVVGLEPHLVQGPSINYRRVAALVHALVSEGWLVEAEGLRYRAIKAPRLRVRSGIDWLEIDAPGDDSGGAAVDMSDLIKAVAAGRRTVTLGDGTIGMLPEEWLARIAPVLAIGEAAGTGVRFKPSQVTLIDALLATQPAVDWDESFIRARDNIQRFEGVHAEDAPETFCGVLREYQREALGWMRFLRDFGFGGCLADDMGLGKTVMVLAMLEARRIDQTRPHRPSLIVMPRSLLFNWTSEASRFAPGLRVLDFARTDRHSATEAITEADVVLTTYGTLRRDAPALRDYRFDYIVLDEAQAIKNAGTVTAKAVRLLQADHRLALSGTPVENHLGELYSLFDFLNPGLLGRGGVLDPRKQTGGGDPHEHIARLSKGLRPFFLRRTKEQVAPELPPRTEETLYCELEGEQRRTYEELRQHYRRSLLKKIDRDGLAKSRFQILEALLRLRQAACHTGLLPGQRAPAGQTSAKFDLLLPRLVELMDEGRKALVFSQFTSLLALLRTRLEADGIAYEYLDGETRDREARVARFQGDPSCPLFLISLKAGGVGLNLTAAEYVFLLDPWWNPAVEMQAIDRAHRIGQVKPVFAYRLVARETVEERILELQSHKRALADAILDAGTGGLRGLQREDLEQLLS